MSEPFDAAAARARLDAADRWGSRESNATWVRWCREHAVNDLRAALDALDRERAALADADVPTYANALQIENDGLWRELAAAQAALTLSRAAHRVTREALDRCLDYVRHRPTCDTLRNMERDCDCGLTALAKTVAALAATEGEGAL